MNLSLAHLLYDNPSKDLSEKDYYPGGMVMPERSFSYENYGFGYQGSLRNDEIKGLGNSYTTFFRENDPRLVRWWSIDPKTSVSSSESPYFSMNGNPILKNDILGDMPPDKYIDQTGKTLGYDKDGDNGKTRVINTDKFQEIDTKFGSATDKGTEELRNSYDKESGILFDYNKKNEKEIYNTMWATSFNQDGTTKENAVLYTTNGMLLLPNDKNKGGEIDLSTFKNLKLNSNPNEATIFKFANSNLQVFALAHTHPANISSFSIADRNMAINIPMIFAINKNDVVGYSAGSGLFSKRYIDTKSLLNGSYSLFNEVILKNLNK